MFVVTSVTFANVFGNYVVVFAEQQS